MPDYLIYVGTRLDDPDRDRMIRLAAELVEYLTATADDAVDGPIGRVALVAPAEDTLGISLPMLGRTQPRTVESGNREPSNLTIFPAFPADGFAALHADRPDDTQNTRAAAAECLTELVERGAVESPLIEAGHWTSSAAALDLLRQAWSSGDWRALVTFGDDTTAREFLAETSGAKDLRLVAVPPVAEIHDRELELLERGELEPKVGREDDWREARLEGLREALQFEELLVRLGLARRPRRS